MGGHCASRHIINPPTKPTKTELTHEPDGRLTQECRRWSAVHDIQMPCSLACGQSAGQPVQSLIQPITGSCARRLNEPLPVPQLVQPKFLNDLCSSHGVGQVLLVGKNKKHGITQFLPH